VEGINTLGTQWHFKTIVMEVHFEEFQQSLDKSLSIQTI
jgi:hypothetical protein